MSKCPACGYWAFNGHECFDCGYRPGGGSSDLGPEPLYLDGDGSVPCRCPEGFHIPGGCDGDE